MEATMLARSGLISFLFAVAAAPTAMSQEPPPPPTSPTSAIPMALFGLIPQGKSLFSSYDTGTQTVGTPFFPRIWYRFSIGNGEALGTDLIGSFVTSTGFDASLALFDGQLKPLGQFNTGHTLTSGSYFVEVTANQPTKYHFGVVGVPTKKNFKNDAGRSEDAALPLGTLLKATTHTNDFYTFFDRQEVSPTGPATPGELTPNFMAPDPQVQTEFYSFELASASTMKVISISQDDDTFIIHARGDSKTSVLKNGSTAQFSAGSYVLEIVDKLTQVSGGGGTTAIFRDPHAENYEHHTFELLLTEMGPVSSNPTPGQPESSSLGSPPKGQCIQIGSQRIGC
jgi:hypothetical protein